MVLLDLHHGIKTIPRLGVPHQLHLLMMTLIYHPLLHPTLKMSHPEGGGGGEVEMDEEVEEVKLHLEEERPLVAHITQGVPQQGE